MTAAEPVRIPVSHGEIVDKITILEIKQARITDAEKLHNIKLELDMLSEIWNSVDAANASGRLRAQLKAVNEQLWEIEDDIRDEERNARFEAEFIRLARAVYVTNDQRAELKKKINQLMGSTLIEEKSYQDYQPG